FGSETFSVKEMARPHAEQGTFRPFTRSVLAFAGLSQWGQRKLMYVGSGFSDSVFLGTCTLPTQNGQVVSLSASSSKAAKTFEQEEHDRKIIGYSPPQFRVHGQEHTLWLSRAIP